MPRHVRPVIYLAISTALVVGCAPPTELSFGVQDAAPVTQDSSAEVTSDVNAKAAVGEISSDADPATSDADNTTAAIEQSFGSLIALWTDCFHRPARCEINRLTAPESPERQRLADSVAFYAAEQLRTKPDEGELEWSIESLSVTSSDRARLLTCEYDTRIFFDVSMADTELGDIIFDATVWTRHVEWTVAKVNDSWQLWSRRIERRSPAVRFCAP